MTDDPLCKGCKQPTHPSYIARYGGYCLDCENAGVPDLMEELDGMRGELKQSNDTIAALQLKVDILEAANSNLLSQLNGKFEYVGQDFAYRIKVKDERIAILESERDVLVRGWEQAYKRVEADDIEVRRKLFVAEAERDSETRWAKQYHDDWVKARDELATQRDATKSLMLEIFGELNGDESASIGDIAEYVRRLHAKIDEYEQHFDGDPLEFSA